MEERHHAQLALLGKALANPMIAAAAAEKDEEEEFTRRFTNR
jgi:hypothetical protein